MATQVEKNQTSQTAISHKYEIAAVIILAFSVLTFLSLVSYNETDYVPFITPTSNQSKNIIGVVGACISGFLIDGIIGWSAYFIPALLVLLAWRVYRGKSIVPRISQILGYFLFILSLSGLFSLFGMRGGLLGAFIFKNLPWLLGTIGAGIFLFAVLIASALVITNLSFVFISENLQIAFENFRIHFDEWQEKRREAKRQIEPKPEKLPVVKSEKKPTISNGEPIVAEKKGKPEKAKSEVSEMLKEFANAPENKPSEFENEIPFEEKIEEPIVPTISSPNEKPFEKIEPKNDFSFEAKKDDSFAHLNKEIAPIEITPVKETGDLTKETGELARDLIEEEQTIEPKPIEAQKPQNFDNYILPTSEFLVAAPPHLEQKEDELLEIAQQLTEKTKEFKVDGRVMHICQGPVVTTYEFKPDPGVKYSRVTGLADDLCLALKAESIRIERIPGKAFVGIEVPNVKRETIHLREVVESKKFTESGSLLTIALGKKIDGLNYVADLAKMPHLLIAGATGAGKSVGVNTLVVSILYKAKPDEVKFIMVDPKRLELGLYADIPHLATPIITDPKRAAVALKWAVSEMEKRYKYLAGWGVRNIDGFNEEVKKRNAEENFDEDGNPHQTLPFIVIIIDELADLMMTSGKEVEESITRLAQMARAVGIHLVLATQRPSVDVITGLIKANFPSRISFRVSSKVDSRTIIDGNGAERLLGRGDMLFLPPASSQVVRVHGAFIDEKEIHKIVEHVKAQGKPEYDTTITKTEEEMDEGELPGRSDQLFWDAVRTVVTAKKASTSLLQRHLRIGYGRAAAILDAMVREGYIGDMDGSSRARPILQKAYDDLQDIEEQENVQ